MEHHRVGLGVEREPRCPWVPVPWLADAAGVDQPPAVAGLQQRPVAGLGAADVAAGSVVAGEEEGDMRVADRADPLSLRVEAGIRLLTTAYVFFFWSRFYSWWRSISPHWPDGLSPRRTCQRLGAHRLLLFLTAVAAVSEKDSMSSASRFVVARQQSDICPLPFSVFFFFRAIADEVSPSMSYDLRLPDRVQAGLEGGQAWMDVGDRRNAHSSVLGAYSWLIRS